MEKETKGSYIILSNGHTCKVKEDLLTIAKYQTDLFYVLTLVHSIYKDGIQVEEKRAIIINKNHIISIEEI